MKRLISKKRILTLIAIILWLFVLMLVFSPVFEDNSPTRERVKYSIAVSIMRSAKDYFSKQLKEPTISEIENFMKNMEIPNDHNVKEYAEVKDKLRVRKDNNRIIVYYIGPDGIDQQGKVLYDPTNGSISEGDACMEIY